MSGVQPTPSPQPAMEPDPIGTEVDADAALAEDAEPTATEEAEAAQHPAFAEPESTMPGVLLRASGLTKRFGGLVAVRDVHLDIPERGIVSLIGPNGAGKTTLFNMVAGILDPTAGYVDFRGRRMIARPFRTWMEPIVWVLPALGASFVTLALYAATQALAVAAAGMLVALALLILMLLAAIVRPGWYQRLLFRIGVFRSARPNDVVQAGIGRTFQNIRLFQNMTTLENVLVGMHTKLSAGWTDALFSTRRHRNEEADAEARAEALLKLVGLEGRGPQLAKNLPYGDQRRLEVARALASEPVLLLLDEPTAGMNPHETAEMTALISHLRNELGIAVLLIEHDMKVVMGISDRITVLDHGEPIAEGSPEEVRRDPRVIEAYLGAPSA